jgi:hypothetical protein
MSNTERLFWSAIGITSGLTAFFFGISSIEGDVVRGWITTMAGIAMLVMGFRLAPFRVNLRLDTDEKGKGSIPSVTAPQKRSSMTWLRKYWWIPTIALVVVAILCFAIWVEMHKSAEGSFAQRIFTFLDSWALVLSAATTLILAAIAVWAVLKPVSESRRTVAEQREREFRRRLLDGILEWAVRVKSECLKPRMVEGGGWELQMGLSSCATQVDWVVNAADCIAPDFRTKVNQAANDLKHAIHEAIGQTVIPLG